VFGNTDKVGFDWSDDDHALSKMLVLHWTNFAKTGDPNASGDARWPAFNRHSLTTRVLNPTPSTVSGVKKRALEIFASRQPFVPLLE
jgi:carboxylesterase type B